MVNKRLREQEFLVGGVGGVAAEEGIGLPGGTRIGIGDGNQKLANDFFIQSCRSGVNGPGEIIRRRVIAVGEPILENLLLGGAGIESDIDFHGRDSVADEIVLIAANESVAQW